MVMEVRPLQYKNAPLPMLVTELPMVTEVRPLQPENADLPIVVTELGMVYVPCFPLGYRISSVCDLLNNTPSIEEQVELFSSTLISVRPLQPENADLPIVVTELGIVYAPCFPVGHRTNSVCDLLNTTPSMEEQTVLFSSTLISVRPLQPENADSPMLVTGKIITLQKSFCYLASNGNQVTIQKRAELHILSRYTHFQRTLLSECKDNHLFCYHQRNGQKLNVFIGFCYLFLGYFMSFSYLFPFGNDFLFLTIGSLSVHYPHGRLLRYWAVLLLP